MRLTLHLTDQQAESLRRCAERDGRSEHDVALVALDDYLQRARDDEATDSLAEHGARRFGGLLRRLGD